MALVLLALLAVVGVGAMAWYMLVGHNWNVAASNIDDSIGQMEGYAVVLYEGTSPAPEGASASSSSEGRQPADISVVANDYLDKGATVFVVDAADLDRYREPFIVAKNGKRFGFLAAGSSERRSRVRADAVELSDGGAGFVVALTDDVTLCENAAEGLVGPLSIVICDDPEGEAASGEYRGSTYCVSAPEVGRVGAVIVSPSGVLSSKVIDGPRDGESSRS